MQGNGIKIAGISIASASLFFGGNLLSQCRGIATVADLRAMGDHVREASGSEHARIDRRMTRIETNLERASDNIRALSENVRVLEALEERRKQ